MQVSRDTVKRWLREGKLKGKLLGDRAGWRITEEDLDAFVRARGGQPPQP